MPGTADAMASASKLFEVGFPEFTAKLINDVFDAIISSNLRQIEAYSKMTKELEQPLKDFIGGAKDDISGEMILNFLITVLPDKENPVGTIVRRDNNNNFTPTEITTLNNALKIDKVDGQEVAKPSETISSQYDDILEAVAKRISASKFVYLKDVISLGLIRVIVDNGEIESMLSFSSYGSSFYGTNSSEYNRNDYNFKSVSQTKSPVSPWVNSTSNINNLSIGVHMADQSSRDISGSQVQIFSRVKLTLKTDYQKLS